MSTIDTERATVTITLTGDGGGTVTVGDQTVPVRGAVLSDARVQALEIVRAVAAQLGRPLRVHAIDPTSSAYLTVDPSGTIHDIDQHPVSDPMPAPDQVTPAPEESELAWPGGAGMSSRFARDDACFRHRRDAYLSADPLPDRSGGAMSSTAAGWARGVWR